MNTNINFLFYLISSIVDIYLYVLLLRMLLQKLQGPYYNKISQFVIKVTDPVLQPLQKFIPLYQGIDLAIIFLVLILEIVLSTILLSIQLGAFPNLIGIILFSIATIADKVINLFFFAIIIDSIISWFPSLGTSPIAPIVHTLASPLTALGRRFIPILGGIDFSPIIVLICLKLITIIFLFPIAHVGIRLVLQPFTNN